MNQEQRVEALIALHIHLETLVGKNLVLTESITDREFDRHGTTMTIFSFTLKSVTGRISGGRLMLNGLNEELYEISPSIIDSRISNNIIEVVEILGVSVIDTPLKRQTRIETK